jgi:hypothetical protein
MTDPSLNLPQALLDLDERLLPQKCREEIARMVALGHRRAHMMINAKFDVHISQELAMLHDRDEDEDETAE